MIVAVAVAALIGVGAWALVRNSRPTTATVHGTFTLHADADSISYDGLGCSGDDGYGDINSSTSVVLTNKAGDELDRTPLGVGELDGDSTCVYHFTLKATKGSPYYLIAISHRGQQQYTWKELTTAGDVDITLGG